MRTGDKENAMTVTLSKRLFEGDATTASLTSPTPASKKMRVSAPLSEHLSASALSKPGSASLGPLNQQHHSSARKRRHDAASEHTNAAASPSNVGKRGKRGDGRPSTAAASPNSAKSALEALLTCEGLEKDADVEAEVAYITARQSTARTAAAGTADNNDAARPSSSGGAAGSSADQQDSPPPAAGGSGSSSDLDAARSSREKRRDQDQNPRVRRVSSGARNIRDQLASPVSPEESAAATATAADLNAAAAEAEPGSPPAISLDIIGDKEWQRLFAVLTISDAAASRCSSNGSDRQPGTAAAATEARGVGSRSHRLTHAVDTSAAATAGGLSAAGAVVQEAPSTPTRLEGAGSGAIACDLTPTRRTSFLAGEWQRVQQQRLSTPLRAPAAAAGSAPFEADCDMGMM